MHPHLLKLRSGGHSRHPFRFHRYCLRSLSGNAGFFLHVIVIPALFLFCAGAAGAQTTDTVTVDSAGVHSVKKAVIFSAVLPGAGQVYNHLAMPKGRKKAYWKVPLIYAGLGATGYSMIRNNQLRAELRAEYDNRQEGNETLDKYAAYDDEGILQLHDMHRTRRDLSILAFGVVYLLNVVDAGVEAHFVNFDVSDDLSLSWEPVLVHGYAPGVGLKLRFR